MGMATNPEGFNPLRWECEKDGCFNIKRRPKIQAFAGCFPRGINFGDVDGLVELAGAFCLLEWKGRGGSVKTGQRMSYIKFTLSHGNIVFVVSGDAETMEVTDYSIFWRGKQGVKIVGNLRDVKKRISAWAKWVETAK